MTVPTDTEVGWTIAGGFLDALTRRDFEALQACLTEDVRFRALVPRGPFELSGASTTADRFRTWFGDKDVFELLDAAIGQIGPRVYMRWRFHTSAGVVEQHAFATGTERIDSLDLMCSGFQRG
jgi:ketosteroid isomerase-like protein